MKKSEQKELPPAIRESRMAQEEFFKNRPKPKTEKEFTKQLEEFVYWYNNVRKQSDTGKTPAKMYKEIYGKQLPVIKCSKNERKTKR